MGPRSRERGNAGWAGPRTVLGWLQWGRAHVSAEMVKVFAICTRLSGLQWGRAHVSAEMKRWVRKLRRDGVASMGPRSRERGNPGAVAWRALAIPASMGPRSRERGNSA